MKTIGILACGVSGAIGATVGYFVPDSMTSGFVIGAAAVTLGAADFVIKDSLKRIDDRITKELGVARSAFRFIEPLVSTRCNLLRLSLVAMICKGIAVAAAGLATQGKATPLILSIGCGALVLGAVLTGVIYVSHEDLIKRANKDALESAEIDAAMRGASRLGEIHSLVDIKDRPVIALSRRQASGEKKPRRQK